MPSIRFQFERFLMLELSEVSAGEVASYFLRNQAHLADSMPSRVATFYAEDFWVDQIDAYGKTRELDREIRWFLQDGSKVIGHIGFDQIVRGPFQSCYVGYGMDAEYQGLGFMREGLVRSLDYMMRDLSLNRVMANFEPGNVRSDRLLQSLGFEREGYARRYLKLNGEWRDHVLTSLVADKYLADT